MTCFSPVNGFESVFLTVNGKHSFTLNKKNARRINNEVVKLTVPCRKCEGCRYDYSREWAIRIMHEADMNTFNGISRNSFITLTYNEANKPLFGSLQYKEHWVPFLKRLRKEVFKQYGIRFKFFMIGEYGTLELRPHYHAILFGFDFPDKLELMVRNGNVLYRSPLLERCWTRPHSDVSFGFSSVGAVTFNSAAYVARYSFKKLIGNQFDGFEEVIDEFGEVHLHPKISKRYVRYNQETGDEVIVQPERAFMSNGGGSGEGGIGKSWFDKYGEHDMYSVIEVDGEPRFKDGVHLSNGMLVRPSKYYDKLFNKIDAERFEAIKLARKDHMSSNQDEFSTDRLRQKRECLLQKMKNKTRNIGDVYK